MALVAVAAVACVGYALVRERPRLRRRQPVVPGSDARRSIRGDVFTVVDEKTGTWPDLWSDGGLYSSRPDGSHRRRRAGA